MASTDLAKLVVKLEVQTAEYQKGFDRATKQLSKFQKSTDSSLKSIQRSFASVQRGMAAFGVGLGLASLTAAFTASAKAAIDFGDTIQDAVAKTGMGGKAIQELAYVAKQNDIELDALTTAFKKLQTTISEAGSGNKAALETFRALGLEFDALRALKPEDQFERIAEQISQLKDPADRVRAAVELFGRAGAELLPMFEQGADGIRQAREEFEKMGGALGPDEIQALADAHEATVKLGQAWDRLARTLTAAVAPALTEVFNAMTNVLKEEPKVISMGQAWDAFASAFSKHGIGTTYTDILRELDAAQEVTQRFSTGTRMAPGGHARGTTAPPPGYQPSADKAGNAAALAAERERLKLLQEQSTAYENVLQAGMAAIEGLRTPTEEQIAQYHEAKYALEELARTYPNMTAQAQEALKKLEVEGLEDIQLTAQKIFPEKERTELSVYWEEAGRGFQDIIADFLVDPFHDGLDGMLKGFVDLLAKMAAEAAAAQIAQKIFGTPGSGGGLLGDLIGIGASFLSGGGAMAGLGDIPITAQYLPAGGGRAAGGSVSPGMRYLVGDQGKAEWFVPQVRGHLAPAEAGHGMMVNQNFAIDAPAGTVSRATLQQIAAASARGLANANRRNN